MSENEIYLPREQSEPGKGGQPPQLSQDLRQSYIHMLDAGHTLGPDDFSSIYHAQGHNPIVGLHDHLPTQEALIDSALSALQKSSLPITPELVDQTKANLGAHWAATGEHPSDAVADPIKADAMTRRPAGKVTEEEFLALAEHDESGGKNVKNYMFDATHTASGYWQITNSTWKDTAPGTGVDLKQYPTADSAPRDVQKEVARQLYRERGTAPWTNFNAKLTADLNLPPGLQQPHPATFDPMEKVEPAEPEPKDLMAHLPAIAEAAGMPRLGTVLARAETSPPQEENIFVHLLKSILEPTGPEPSKETIEELRAQHPEATPDEINMMARLTEGPGTVTERLGRMGQVVMGGMGGPAAGGALGAGPAIVDGVAKAFREMPLAQEAAQASIRKATGEGRRIITRATDALEPMRREANRGVPAFRDWLATRPGQVTPMWDQNTPDIMRMIDHMEGGNGGSQLAPSSPLFPVAESIRQLYKAVRQLIEVERPDMTGFVENYYRHLWTRPTDADQAFGAGRRGSSASLQHRTIPTLADGIAQGLVPRILDPIENALHYVTGMVNHLMTTRVVREGEEAGYIAWHTSGEHPAGWVELNNTTRGPFERAYAPPEFASPYNNFIGRGFYEWGQTAGDIFQKIQQASNFMTAMKLGLSGYHAVVISQATVASALTSGIGKVTHGELINGLKDIGFGATVAPALADRYMKGRWLQQAYLRPEGTSSDFYKNLADIYAKVGGRAVGRAQEYGYAQASNWYDAWRRGSLAFDIRHNLGQTLGDESEHIVDRIAWAAPRFVGAVGHELGRAMGTIMKPLFENAIPRLKAGAWSDEMATWIRQNPRADEEAILRQGRKLSDHVDNIYGEMVQDNLFWPRALKQSLNVATVSVGWNWGTLRAIGGGLKDVAKGDLLSPRARLLVSYPIAMGLIGAVYQYLKTGIAGPTVLTPGTDIMAPRTGGVTLQGTPERAQLPGEQKEPYQWFHAMQQAPNFLDLPHQAFGIAAGKMSPFAQMLTGLATNKDWRQNPNFSNVPDPGELEPPAPWTQLGRFVLEGLEPIGAESMANRKQGTNISRFEQSMGVRSAASWIQSPEWDAQMRAMMERKQIKTIQRQRARAAAQQEQ